MEQKLTYEDFIEDYENKNILETLYLKVKSPIDKRKVLNDLKVAALLDKLKTIAYRLGFNSVKTSPDEEDELKLYRWEHRSNKKISVELIGFIVKGKNEIEFTITSNDNTIAGDTTDWSDIDWWLEHFKKDIIK